MNNPNVIQETRSKLILVFLLMLILQASVHECIADETTRYFMPAHAFDATFSTNWINAVKAALPEHYSTETNFNFQRATNYLCEESQNGNNLAQGLWGFTLVTLSRSPEDAEAGLQLMIASAEKGNIPVMSQLGLLYKGGKFVRRNYNESFRWFSLAAAEGDPNSEYELGLYYQRGLGTTPDLALALKWYRLAAEQTNYIAMNSLGHLLMSGQGTNVDLETAKYWFARSAKEGGNRRAMYNLGVVAARHFPDTNSMLEAFQWYKQSAELGDDLACFELAQFYNTGWGGVQTNLESFCYWLRKAALLGHTEAQFELGERYGSGNGVPKSPQDSLFWLNRAAAKNHPKALYALAIYYHDVETNQAALVKANKAMLLAAKDGHRHAQLVYAMHCFHGDGAPVDCESGKLWLMKSAEAGYANAEFTLFQYYFNGFVPNPECPAYPKDKVEAIKWLRRAAAHEYYRAQSMLAVMQIQGTEVEKDTASAEKLLRNAATHGYPEGQGNLGFCIQNGDINSTDLVESAMWSRLAIDSATDPNTITRSKVNLANVLSQLTPDQKLEVEERVKGFKVLPGFWIDPMLPGWETRINYQQDDD